MPKRVHAPMSFDEKIEQVRVAMRQLHAEGFYDIGLAEICRQIDLPWVRVRGRLATGVLRPYVLALIEDGAAKRIPLGTRRGRYKLIEDI